MPHLSLLEIRPNPGSLSDLVPGLVIGRGRDCQVRVLDPSASRRHALLRSAAIEDIGSENGVFVNGRRAAGTVALHEGDVVRVGMTVWRVVPAPSLVSGVRTGYGRRDETGGLGRC